MTIKTEKAISLKRLVGAAKAPEAGKTVWLVRVFGTCVGVKTGTGDKGEWTRYLGDFIAKTLVPVGRDAEIRAARASELYLPGPAEDLMSEAGITDESEGQFNDFGLKIGIAADAKGKPQYVAEWLVEPTPSSPAEALVKQHAPDMLGEADAPQAAPKPAPQAAGTTPKRK